MPAGDFFGAQTPTPKPGEQSARIYPVIVVGAGFAGIGAAIKLRQAGCDFLVLEKAGEVGGVWRDNTYPDCACDIPSSFYSYSFAPNPRWSRLFAKQPEIKAYAIDTAQKFGVTELIRLNHELTQARWDQAERLWRLQTNAGEFLARFVIMACGPMHVPVAPSIPGLDSFPGRSFHSANWPQDPDLQGKRVAVVGTGASAIQFVPLLAKQVPQLAVFQRTAPWVLPKIDGSISPGWQRLFEKIPLVQAGFRKLLYLQFELLSLSLKYPSLIKRIESVGRRNIFKSVKDKALRARLLPDFALGCKRILMSNTWYPALAQPHVRVLPGVARIEGQALVASDGQRFEADVIIFALGFEVAEPPIGKCIVGLSGVPLAQRWQGSADAYLGTMTQDCPNLFLTFGPNLYTYSSAFVMLEAQLQFIISAIQTAQRAGIVSIAIDPQKYQSYNRQIQTALHSRVWNSGCSSYFIDKNGHNSSNWPWTTWYMRRRLSRFKPSDFLIEHGSQKVKLQG